ncbi:hypothetical protein AB6D53_16230 [Vibrio splendidus]
MLSNLTPNPLKLKRVETPIPPHAKMPSVPNRAQVVCDNKTSSCTRSLTGLLALFMSNEGHDQSHQRK